VDLARLCGHLNRLDRLPDYVPEVADGAHELLCHEALDLSITVTDTDGRERTDLHRVLASGGDPVGESVCEPLPGCGG